MAILLHWVDSTQLKCISRLISLPFLYCTESDGVSIDSCQADGGASSVANGEACRYIQKFLQRKDGAAKLPGGFWGEFGQNLSINGLRSKWYIQEQISSV